MHSTDDARDGATTTNRQPWDRLEHESADDYAAFEAYMRMPAPRSAGTLAKSSGLPSRSLDRTRTRNNWKERAAAYDAMRLEQALLAAPREAENPYERMLHQVAKRAADLHDTASNLLSMANRRMQWAERAYQRDLAKCSTPAEAELVEPPVPTHNLVAAIRGAAEVMDKSGEAQALALGITDVLKMQSSGAAAQ